MFLQLPLLATAASAAATAVASASAAATAGTGWFPHHGQRAMDNLVMFGDSYTDESRLAYFFQHSAPPPLGQMTPESNQTSGGGKVWGRVVADKTGARLYDYAVGGAMCSDNITSHWMEQIHGPFPSVLDYEVPTFEADLAYKDLYPDRTSSNTVYTLWIGTNDLGIDGFLGDKNVRGTSLPDYVDCTWTTFDRIYKTGGRRFVLLNNAPLELSPMYAAPENGGTGNNGYWPDKVNYNMTEYQYKMYEYTMATNRLFKDGMALNFLLKNRWPGASLAYFDVHQLIKDIHANPKDYLTAPYEVTKAYTDAGSGFPLSGFLWYVT